MEPTITDILLGIVLMFMAAGMLWFLWHRNSPEGADAAKDKLVAEIRAGEALVARLRKQSPPAPTPAEAPAIPVLTETQTSSAVDAFVNAEAAALDLAEKRLAERRAALDGIKEHLGKLS